MHLVSAPVHRVRCSQSLLLCISVAKLSPCLSRFLRRVGCAEFQHAFAPRSPAQGWFGPTSVLQKILVSHPPRPVREVSGRMDSFNLVASRAWVVRNELIDSTRRAFRSRFGPYFCCRCKSQWCSHDDRTHPGGRVLSRRCEKGRVRARRSIPGVGRGRSSVRDRHRDDCPRCNTAPVRHWPVSGRGRLPLPLLRGPRQVAFRAQQGPQGHPDDQATGARVELLEDNRQHLEHDRDRWSRMQAEEASINRRLAEGMRRVQRPRVVRRVGERGHNQPSDTPDQHTRGVLHSDQLVPRPTVEATPPSATAGRQSAGPVRPGRRPLVLGAAAMAAAGRCQSGLVFSNFPQGPPTLGTCSIWS